MKLLLLCLTFLFSMSIASECVETIPLNKVESIAKVYVGNITSVKLSKEKRENICVYRVSGSDGYVVIDASNGELLRFSKRKSR